MPIPPLHKRIFEISKKYNLGHIGSNITAVDIIDEIYSIKKSNDKFVLSSGHAGLALYVVLEKYEKLDAEKLYQKHFTHPNRDVMDGIHASSGSLGCGVTIALGMAMANRKNNIYCLMSDGEIFEGSFWEVCNVKHKYCVNNFHLYVNINGFSCIEEISSDYISRKVFCNDSTVKIKRTSYKDYPFLDGVKAHYYNLTDKDLQLIKHI